MPNLFSISSSPPLPKPPRLGSLDEHEETRRAYREDGRVNEQLRYPIILIDQMHAADGACRYSQGKSEVFVILNTGSANAGGGMSAGRHFGGGSTITSTHSHGGVEVQIRPCVGVVTVALRRLENLIAGDLKRCIDVSSLPFFCMLYFTILIVNDDGAIESVCFNGAVAALLAAGVPAKHIPTAVCIGLCSVPETGSKSLPGIRLLLDPTLEESVKDCIGLLFLTFDGLSGGMIQCSQLKGYVFLNIYTWNALLKMGANAAFTICKNTRGTFYNTLKQYHSFFVANNYENKSTS